MSGEDGGVVWGLWNEGEWDARLPTPAGEEVLNGGGGGQLVHIRDHVLDGHLIKGLVDQA